MNGYSDCIVNAGVLSPGKDDNEVMTVEFFINVPHK